MDCDSDLNPFCLARKTHTSAMFHLSGGYSLPHNRVSAANHRSAADVCIFRFLGLALVSSPRRVRKPGSPIE